MFDINKPSDQHWNPVFNVATNVEKAGAEFVVYTGNLVSNGGWNKAFENGSNRFKIWMSPVDDLRLIFGLNGFKLNEEHIRWSKSDSGAEDYGYSINYTKDGLAIDLALLPGWNTPWMVKAENAAGDSVTTIKTTALKVAYGADFGTFSALFVANPSADSDGKMKNFNNIKFGAGYVNTFSGISMFANVLGYLDNSKFTKLRAEIWANGNVDAFGWSVFPVVEIYPEAEKDKVELFLLAKVTYQLEPCQVYFEFADLQGMITKFFKNGGEWDDGYGALFTLGATGNVGGASWDVGARINLREKVAFSVPVSFSFGW